MKTGENVSPQSILHKELQRKLTVKQRELAQNERYENHPNAEVRKLKAQAAARNRKSITLLVSKVMCVHKIVVSRWTKWASIKCEVCKATMRHP